MINNAVAVLMYHRIGETNNAWERKYCISPERFAAHMTALAGHGIRGVSVENFVRWLDGSPMLPNCSVIITFDDGFRDVREYAMPVLERHDWPATVFLVSDMIGQHDNWTQAENPSGQTYPLLNADDIRDMAARGVSFHSHTCAHTSLPKADDAKLFDERARSRRDLSDLFGFSCEFLAYPFGHVGIRVENAARAAGFSAAFSTQPGFNRPDVDRFQLRRLDIWGTDTPAMLLCKITLGSNDERLGAMAKYYFSRLKNRLGKVAA